MKQLIRYLRMMFGSQMFLENSGKHMKSFIDGIRQGGLLSDDIDNDLLCKRLEEIYLSI